MLYVIKIIVYMQRQEQEVVYLLFEIINSSLVKCNLIGLAPLTASNDMAWFFIHPRSGKYIKEESRMVRTYRRRDF